MKIFLSYSSEDKDVAEQVQLRLTPKHRVFFDKITLPPGSDYDVQIRKAIAQSKLFIFLISPDSVANSTYALTELNLARKKWPSPYGHVLPVMVRATDHDSIPNYLKEVTILKPEGNVASEVSTEVGNRLRRDRVRLTKVVCAVAVAALVCLAVAYYIFRPAGAQNGAAHDSNSNTINQTINANAAPSVTPTPAREITPTPTPTPSTRRPTAKPKRVTTRERKPCDSENRLLGNC